MILSKVHIRLQIIAYSQGNGAWHRLLLSDHKYLTYIYQDLKLKIEIHKHSIKQVLSSTSKDGNVAMGA